MRSGSFTLVLVLIASLFLFSHVQSFEFSTIAEVKELRNTNYGNSLIETISLTLQNKGSVEEVQKLLTDLLYKLNKDQEESDKSWEIDLRNLNEKIDKLTKQIEALRVEISELTERRVIAISKKEAATANLVTYRVQLEKDKKNLMELNQRRDNDKAQYKISVSDHNDMINALEAVIAELSKLIDDKEAVQQQVQAEVAVQNSFLQTSNKSKAKFPDVRIDQVSLNNLIEALQRLQLSAKKSLNDDEVHEQKSIEIYLNLTKSLEADIGKLENAIEEEEKNLKDYIIQITELTNKIEHLSTLKQSKSGELQSTTKERNDKDNQYVLDKEERIKEKTTVLKLQDVVKERLESMSRFLQNRSGA